MDIIPYAEEHRIFRDAVRKFLDKEVVPHIEEWEEAGIVPRSLWKKAGEQGFLCMCCLLYTSDAADDLLCVDLGGRRIIKKKTNRE